MSTYEVYCKHKFVIDGREYGYDEAEEVLKNMQVGDKVTIVHNGAEYAVERVVIDVPWGGKPMYEIRAVTPKGEFFMLRREYSFDVLIDMIMAFRRGDGFVRVHGNVDHPLDEFRWVFENARLSEVRDGVWIFGGNHKHFSGVFRYIIWDEKLAEEIDRRLKTGFIIKSDGVTFKDYATEYGLRLVGITHDTSIEIGLYAGSEGDFMVEEYTGVAEYRFFKTFDEVVEYITEKYGRNNLSEFKQKAERLREEMLRDPYVRKWKKVS